MTDQTAANVAAPAINNPAQAALVADTSPNILVKEFSFGFRKQKDEETGVETKRPNVETKLALLSFDGIVDVLTNKDTEGRQKEYELLTAAIETVYTDYVKSYLGDNSNVTSENIDPALFTWATIANLPDSDKRGRGIAKETWEEFGKNYCEVMPALINKDKKVVEKQMAVMAQKFNPLRNHEDKAKLLPKFKEMLTIYMNGSKEAEQFQEPVDFLIKKIDTMLTVDTSANLAENLGF